jgi:hypothetical protein
LLKEFRSIANKGDVCVGCDFEICTEEREAFVGWSFSAAYEARSAARLKMIELRPSP